MPLFKVTHGNNSKYLKNNAELEEYKKHNKNFEISRFKGLGEMKPADLRETALNPEKRILKKVVIENDNEAKEMIETLMGNDVQLRKNFIFNALGIKGE
jgi:DNA gyrase/topoisomerase IV subunit B